MRYAKDPQVDSSLRHSVRDGMAFSVMAGGGETYFSAFALFLRASAPQVALLVTMPALVGSLAQLLSIWLGRFVHRRKPVILLGATLQGLAWLPLVGLPVLFPDAAFTLLLLCITLYLAGGHLAAPQWTSLMGDLVPERRRGRFFARRTRLTSATSFVALVTAGVALHLFDEAGHTFAGFVSIFAVAFVARFVSVYHLSRMQEPERESTSRELPLGRLWFASVRHRGAVWFSTYFVLMQTAVGISAPLFSVYMLRDLHFTYFEFMCNTGVAVLVQFLTLNAWGRVSDVFGNRLILVLTSTTVPMLPMLWTISNDFWYLILVQCLSGVSWAGFSLSTGNLLFELVPPRQRATYAAFHNVCAATGVFMGGMLGALLILFLPSRATLLGDASVQTSLLSVFLVSGALRALVAVMFVRRVKDLKKPRKAVSPQAFVFRVTRFNAFVGLVYEWVAPARRSRRPMRREAIVAQEPVPAEAGEEKARVERLRQRSAAGR